MQWLHRLRLEINNFYNTFKGIAATLTIGLSATHLHTPVTKIKRACSKYTTLTAVLNRLTCITIIAFKSYLAITRIIKFEVDVTI